MKVLLCAEANIIFNVTTEPSILYLVREFAQYDNLLYNLISHKHANRVCILKRSLVYWHSTIVFGILQHVFND